MAKFVPQYDVKQENKPEMWYIFLWKMSFFLSYQQSLHMSKIISFFFILFISLHHWCLCHLFFWIPYLDIQRLKASYFGKFWRAWRVFCTRIFLRVADFGKHKH